MIRLKPNFKMRLLIFGSILAAGLVHCAMLPVGSVSDGQIRRVTQGMSREEVRAVLGQPARRDKADSNWTYKPIGWENREFLVLFDSAGRVDFSVEYVVKPKPGQPTSPRKTGE